ncbi:MULTISPECIES: hypothetical protein [unclassified Sphingomonas]|jgi:hypothetical protein|nr:hypothetical protein [Sphingomonas sp.]
MKMINDPHLRYAEATMRLLDTPGARPSPDAFRVICGGTISDEAQTAALLSMALETTGGLLYLEMPEQAVWLGPQRLIVLRLTGHVERRFDVEPDCAFWTADGQAPLLIASRDGSRHFELGEEGLTAHDGSPAGDLNGGFARAAERLRTEAGAAEAHQQPREIADMIEDKALDPEFRLELLASSDPEARANMMRHTVALTGRLHDREVSGLLIGADFKTTLEGVERIRDLTAADGNDRLMVGFDVDDARGPPASFGLWHARKGVTTFYDRCAPWMPPTGNRAWLIAQNDSQIMLFRFQSGRLAGTPGRPAADPWPGIRRARERLAKLVGTPAVRNAVGDVQVRIQTGTGEPTFATLPTGPLSEPR